MCLSRVSIAVFLSLCLNFKFTIGDVTVDTSSGKLSGLEVSSIFPDEKYYSFLGIPFAQPPIGNLRFKAPVPHPGWEGVFQAKNVRKSCAQYYLPQRHFENYGYTGDEDCLYLNVFTPKLPNKEDKLPVIVYLFNEHFRVSYNHTKEYGNDFFMKEGVIIVTMNHRLGALGFVSFEDTILPGNNGLRDVILGLKWINNNIQNFGGDPSRITLMGNSAGGALVDILLLSPKAKGLFSAAILQSETSWHPYYITFKPKKRAIALSEYLKERADTSEAFLQRMSSVSAFRLTEAELLSTDTDEGRALQRGVVEFGPVIEVEHEDAIITQSPDENPSIKLPVPVMIGFNSRESIEMSDRYLHMPHFLSMFDRDFVLLFPRRVNYHFRMHDHIYYKAIEDVKDFYYHDSYVNPSKAGEYLTCIGDMSNFYPIDYTVRKYTNTTDTPNTVYYYMFDYSGELNFRKKSVLEGALTLDGTWGASTGDELCYLFVCHPHRKVYKKLLESGDSDELKVLRNMVKLFTDFAKTGNPTPAGSSFTWKPATKNDRQCLIISDELKMQSNIYKDRVDFWDDFIERYGKEAVDGVVRDVKEEL